ncbi:hypothetical protein HY031_00310 [Candidatus Gottesmanbacteria bacterium]|nr:hypothetical protein [Candidatus Gottesmanbacteria bacterium]
MSGYLFFFGRTPALSQLELSTFFPQSKLLSPSVVLVEQALNPREVIDKLGGTVKIAELVGSVSELSASTLAPFILKAPVSHPTFGISSYDEKSQVGKSLLSEIKSFLGKEGIASRFVEAKDDGVLSSVVVEKQQVVELDIVTYAKGFLVGRTTCVQAFEKWNKRDYQRPFADPHAGMLPPKVARMVVNIAQGGREADKRILLDPFCGMGTILAEAMLSGWQTIGLDQSKEAVSHAQANLDWLMREYPATASVPPKLFVSDATHVSGVIGQGRVDAIVTEPFMGKQTGNPVSPKNILKGLEKLYIGCLKDWHTFLKPNAKVIMAIPQYHVGGKTYTVKNVIDSCEMLGYTTLAGPIEYSRPQAVVRREFYIFQKRSQK